MEHGELDKSDEQKIRYLARNIGYLPGIETEDLVQMAYLKIFLTMPKFNPNKSSKSTWITNVTRNYFFEIRKTAMRKLNKINNEATFDLSFTDLNGDTPQCPTTAEDEIIKNEIIYEIKAQLDDFEKIVLDCKISPEYVYDSKNINLCEKAYTLNKQRQRAIAFGVKLHSTPVIPTNKLIANHLKVSRQKVDQAMDKIKSVTSQAIIYTY